jgi:hypothetical protein
VGVGLPVTPPCTFDHARGNDKHLRIPLIPEKVNQQGVGCFQTDLTLSRCDSQLPAGLIELRQTIRRMRHSQAAQRLAAFIEKTGVVVGVAPIDTEKDLHGASCVSHETEALSADAVTVFLLEPSGGRPLWTMTPGQPGVTVRRERSKRRCKQVINPQVDDRQGQASKTTGKSSLA